MPSLNHVVVMGNVTRDIEIRYTPGGHAVCDIGLALNGRRKQGDTWVDKVTFVDVTCWRSRAEAAGRYLRKGSLVQFVGELVLDEWEQDGQARRKLKIHAKDMQLLDKPPARQEAQEVPDEVPVTQDECPF